MHRLQSRDLGHISRITLPADLCLQQAFLLKFQIASWTARLYLGIKTSPIWVKRARMATLVTRALVLCLTGAKCKCRSDTMACYSRI